MEFSASAMMELIEAVFEGRETVNKYDIVEKAKFYPLGKDGERAVEITPGEALRQGAAQRDARASPHRGRPQALATRARPTNGSHRLPFAP